MKDSGIPQGRHGNIIMKCGCIFLHEKRRPMEKLTGYLAIIIFGLALLGGCAIGKGNYILSKAKSEGFDVFAEAKDRGGIPKGYSNLVIKATIKTHLQGYYRLESKDIPHGTPTYPFLVNISGQAVKWEAEGKEESIPKYTPEGKINPDPDAGEGMKYILEKRVIVKAGPHEVFFGLPGEDYYKEFDVSLNEGESYFLEFKPVYNDRARFTRIPTFLKGVKEYDVFLNGKEI